MPSARRSRPIQRSTNVADEQVRSRTIVRKKPHPDRVELAHRERVKVLLTHAFWGA
jgi:hypothetical protein